MRLSPRFFLAFLECLLNIAGLSTHSARGLSEGFSDSSALGGLAAARTHGAFNMEALTDISKEL